MYIPRSYYTHHQQSNEIIYCEVHGMFTDGRNLWKMILEFWINTFTGVPNVISADRQTASRSKFFKTTCNQLGIHAKITPTESHKSLYIYERYYSIIRRVFNRIRAGCPRIIKTLVSNFFCPTSKSSRRISTNWFFS